MDAVQPLIDGPRLSYEDRRYAECLIFPWQGHDLNLCRGCNKPLTGRQKRWCGTLCSEKWGRNHWWSEASKARRELDDFTCQRCGVRSEPRMSHWEYLHRHRVYGSADGLSRYQAQKLWTGPVLEVNHVWPLAQQPADLRGFRKGETRKRKHSDTGCHHHLSLLVTLCKPCHRRTTNHQFGFKQPSPQLAMEVA